jgi:hypothetical protein
VTHNATASVVSMAKAMLLSVQHNPPETTLPTATLILLCNTLIDLAQRDNPTANKIATKSAAFVSARITGLER